MMSFFASYFIFDLKSIKLLEEYIEEKLYYIAFRHGVLASTPQAEATKVKIDKQNCIKLNFCAAKETINRRKEQPIEWEEKTCSSCISDKGLVYRIYKGLL